MCRYLLLFIPVLIFYSCEEKSNSSIVLDVRSIINKTPDEVIDILGEPDSVYTERILGKAIYCQRYYTNNVEIQYPDSLSTDIVVYGPHGLPFNQTALKAFNLSHSTHHPSQYEKDAVIRWYDFDEFEAISFYNVRRDSLGRTINYSIFFKAKPSPHG